MKKTSTKSMQDYLVKVKGLVKSLVSTSEEVSWSQLISYVVDNLVAEYHVVPMVVRSRKNITFEELTYRLLSEEIMIKMMNSENIVSAFVAPHYPKETKINMGEEDVIILVITITIATTWATIILMDTITVAKHWIQ